LLVAMKIKGQNRSSIFVFVGDVLIIPASYLAGYYLRFGNFEELNAKIPPLNLALMILGYLSVFYFFGLFKVERKYFTLDSLINLILGIIVSAVLVSFLNYGVFLYPIGRGIFIFSNLILFVSIFIWRILFYQVFKYFIRSKRIIVIGAGKAGQETARIIESLKHDFELVGFLDEDKSKTGKPVLGFNAEVLGSDDQLADICEGNKIDQIVITVSVEDKPLLSKNLLMERLKGIDVIEMVELYQYLMQRIPIEYIPESWFLKAKGFDWSDKSIMVKIKRLIDIIISALILLVSLPLWLIIAFLVKISSKGPVFYTQSRIGKNESIFSLYKFRSMIDKAEKDKAVMAEENDKRVTFTGKFLRKLHLDELPQLLNVLRGEMSLVGPRPERPVFVEEFKKKIPYYSLRHFLKPGLTGWAQVNYPYASSLEDSMDKLEYDLYYIYHMTLLLDLRIFLRTAQNIFLRKRSYK